MSQMIDAHLHLHDPRLARDLESIVATLRRLGIGTWVVNGTSPADWDTVEELARLYPEVVPFYGVHPWRCDDLPPDWEAKLRDKVAGNPAAGVGEIGLDRWIRGHDIDRQKAVLFPQLALAGELERPIAIHCLRSWGHLDDVLEVAGCSVPLLLHSFGGPAEFVPRLLDRGAFFSLSGYFFREDKRSKLEVFREIPGDRILLETDAPDMLPPESLREFSVREESPPGKGEPTRPANHPANLGAIYRAWAEFQGIELADLVATTEANFAAWHPTGVRPADGGSDRS